jgi:MFS family permease
MNLAPSSAAPAPPAPSIADGDPRLRKGTLVYTRRTLLVLFFYLLWGDFAFQLMEQVAPAILPLQLKELGASNLTMGVLLTTIPAFFNFAMNPIVSFRSDNLRTAWGRRKPFLVASTPFVALFLVLLPFGPEVGAWLSSLPLLQTLGVGEKTFAIGAIAGFFILFQFANWCMQPIYYYLVVDVVPDAYMARFQSLFRVVATLSSYLFNTFLYGKALTHTKEIFIGCAALYLVGFLWMCFKVKEGDYPPPAHGGKLGFRRAVAVYCRECYSHSHYLFFYGRNAFGFLALGVNIYAVFVLRDEVGLTLDFIGKLTGWSALVSAALLYPLGVLCDKYTPMRIALVGMCLQLPLALINFFFLRDAATATALMLLSLPVTTMLAASELPLYASIPPRERYGQFGSANMIVCSAVAMLGAFPAGWFMDWATKDGSVVANYRYLYLWTFFFQAVSLGFMILLYRSWRKHGGPAAYVPPDVRAT